MENELSIFHISSSFRKNKSSKSKFFHDFIKSAAGQKIFSEKKTRKEEVFLISQRDGFNVGGWAEKNYISWIEIRRWMFGGVFTKFLAMGAFSRRLQKREKTTECMQCSFLMYSVLICFSLPCLSYDKKNSFCYPCFCLWSF